MTSNEDARKVMDVNYWGAHDITKAFLPLVRESQGRVIFIGSISKELLGPHLTND